MKIYLKLAWRDIGQAPARALLTTLSIVIGVAAVLAVSITTRTTRKSFEEVFQTIAGQADLASSGEDFVDRRLPERFADLMQVVVSQFAVQKPA